MTQVQIVRQLHNISIDPLTLKCEWAFSIVGAVSFAFSVFLSCDKTALLSLMWFGIKYLFMIALPE